MRFSTLPPLALLLLSACAHVAAEAPSDAASKPQGPAAAPAAPAASLSEAKPASEELTSDAQRSSPAGATFTAPSGWSLNTLGTVLILQPPEKDSRVAIVDVHAADASAAAAAAWQAYRPEGQRPLHLVTPRPGRNGWEEVVLFDYETSPNERAAVWARASRKGDSWTVVIADGTEPTFEKRAAPVNLIFGSLRPKGYTRESFAGGRPTPSTPSASSNSRTSCKRPWSSSASPAWGWPSSTQGKWCGRAASASGS